MRSRAGFWPHHLSLRTTVSTLEEEFHSPTLKGPAQYWSRGLSFRPSLKNLGSANAGCRNEVKLPSMGYQGLDMVTFTWRVSPSTASTLATCSQMGEGVIW